MSHPRNPGPCPPLQITALFLAAQRGHSEVVRLLVDNGASPVQPCFIQVGALHPAAHPNGRCRSTGAAAGNGATGLVPAQKAARFDQGGGGASPGEGLRRRALGRIRICWQGPL